MSGQDPYLDQGLAMPYPKSTTTNTVYGSFMREWPRTYINKTGPALKNQVLDDNRRKVKITSNEIGSFLNYEPVIRWHYDYGRKRSLPVDRTRDVFEKRYESNRRNDDSRDSERHHLPPVARRRNLSRGFSEPDVRERKPIESAEEFRLPDIHSVDLNFHDNSRARVHVKDIEIHTARF
ncbi:uncharacterized protein LOC135498237 isoform X2 [Lineus longissimus]